MSSMHSFRRANSRGFTIVELLIVIIVIAILAAMTIVAYNGVQRRANNAAIIDAASKSYRMIVAYVAANNAYPLTSGTICLTTTSGCNVTGTAVSGSTTLDTNLASVGTIPRTIPNDGQNHYGIIYLYYTTRTMNGATQPVVLYYWLQGTGQQCGVSNITDSPTTTMLSSVTGYTSANDSGTGKTLCVVSIPGPSA